MTTKTCSQTLRFHNRMHRPLHVQPFSHGVPWPEGQMKDASHVRVLDEQGAEVPHGPTVLNRWPDGSIQWLLLDLSLDFAPSQDRFVTVSADSPKTAAAPSHPCTSTLEDDVATVGNGLTTIVFSPQKGQLLKQWHAGGRRLVEPEGFDVTFKDTAGCVYSARQGPRTLSIEHATPLRCVLRIDGKHAASDGREFLDYFIRIELRADRVDAKVTHSFRNLEQPVPGIEISALSADFDLAVAPTDRKCFTATRLTRFYSVVTLRVDEDVEIVASDTGDIDRYGDTHRDGERGECFVRDPAVLHDPQENKPWFLQNNKFRFQAGGQKCTWPYLGITGDEGGALAAFRGMATLHPKSLATHGGRIHFGLWPEWAGSLRITQGAGRSHTFYLAPLPGNPTDEDLQNAYLSWEMGASTHGLATSAVEIMPDTAHVRACKVFAMDLLPAYEPETHYLFERKVRDAWLGISYGQLGAVDRLNVPPPTGFWDYGDIGANNEEMHARVYFENYFRAGDWACAETGLASAAHIMEVDHVAFSIDPFQNGGMVSHCTRHNNGCAYPSHMWFTELLFAYVLTGDAEFKKAALRMCESLVWWINDEEGFRCVCGDQREAGQPMINLTACYPFNRDPRYLEACRKIIDEYLVANTLKYGRMLDAKPPSCPVKLCIYGDYASYEGMFWYWSITGEEDVKRFMLSQLEWRLTLPFMHVHGFHRTTDYNPAAYAYYMTDDRAWLDRVARPLGAAFRAARWPLGWIHAMYAIKLAFDLGVVSDEDITVQ